MRVLALVAVAFASVSGVAPATAEEKAAVSVRPRWTYAPSAVVRATARVSVPYDKFVWDWGDGGTSSQWSSSLSHRGPAPKVHTYREAGVFAVTVTFLREEKIVAVATARVFVRSNSHGVDPWDKEDIEGLAGDGDGRRKEE